MAELVDAALLLRGDNGRLSVAEHHGVPGGALRAGSFCLPKELPGSLGRRGVFAGPVGATPAPAPLACLDLDPVAWIRLDADDERTGYLVLGSRGPAPFTPAETQLLHSASQRVALHLDDDRPHHTPVEVEQLERLLRLAAQLAGTVHLEVAAAVIVNALVDAEPAAAVAVYRREGARWRLVAYDGGRTPPEDRLPDASAEAVEVVPLLDGAREVAAIAEWELPENERHRQLLAHLADVAGLAVSKIVLHERTAYQARHDALTGLVNRSQLSERIDRALAQHDAQVAVIFCDLDRFKTFNDTLGHDAGDELLIEVARRLRESVRPHDTVARLGGDEFVVLCTEVASEECTTEIAARIASRIGEPVEIAGRTLRLTTSQGVVVAGPNDTAKTLLRDADAAMYRAKEGGRDRFELFDACLRRELGERLEVERTLREVLNEGRLRAVYQPLVEVATGRLRAVEALLRYEDEDGRLVAAEEFIRVAEASDLILELGAWMLDEAIRQQAAWHRELGALAPPRVLVNVSSRELVREFDETVRRTLDRYGVPARAVAIELTESGLIGHGEEVLSCLSSLRRQGVEVGIDDFGTGYSSLTYLKRFPVDFVKIDREFVQGMTNGAEDASIVAAIVRLTEALGLQAVAEGVETSVQRDRLFALGCELAQGFLYAAPLPPAVVVDELLSGRFQVGTPPVRPAPQVAVDMSRLGARR